MAEKQTTEKYEWVNCTNCGGRLFRHVAPKKFNIEMPCGHCKGIWKIFTTEGGGISFEQVRAPKYSYKPKEFKDKGDSP